jgi:hypothetical protein
MTTTTVRSAAPPVLATGLATGGLALFWTVYGAHDWGELLSIAGIVVVATVLVFALAVPRALRRESLGGPALALAIPGLVLALPAFWSGLPFILGVAGAFLGNAGRTRERGGNASLAALAIGVLAALGYLAIYIGDGVIGQNWGFVFEAID